MMQVVIREKRRRLAGEQNHRCCYCGVRFDYDRPSDHPDAPTIEHVVRLADGGRKVWENEVAACRLCNNTRGEMDALEYFERILIQGRLPVHWAPSRRRKARSRFGVKLSPLPPPPVTAKLREYLVLNYGEDRAAEMIEERRLIDLQIRNPHQDQRTGP